jgi:hypothetical protein
MNGSDKIPDKLKLNGQIEEPSIPEEKDKLKNAIEKLAGENPEKLFEFMASHTTMEMGPLSNPLQKKITPEHISKALDVFGKNEDHAFEYHKKRQENEHSEKKSIRRYLFGIFLILFGLIVLILVLFKDKPEILSPALAAIIGLSGGFGAGWGFNKKNPS